MTNACGNCLKPADHRHHVVPKALGGSDEETNLVWLCGGCHGKVHGKKTLNYKNLQRAGIERAKANGVYRGRKSSMDEDQLRSLTEDCVSPTEMAKQLGCTRSAVYKAWNRLGINYSDRLVPLEWLEE